MNSTPATSFCFEPVGMISAFNALGNHPQNILRHFDETLMPRLRTLGRSGYYHIRDRLEEIVRHYQMRSPEFVPLHQPMYRERYLSLNFVDTLVDNGKCQLVGEEDFRRAYRLSQEGHNVLVVQNHTSVLDTFITYAALRNRFGHLYSTMSFLMSQVFEYSRAVALVTAGATKFRVFQPKHMDRMKSQRQDAAAAEMVRQNLKVFRAIKEHCKWGGKMIYFYPERNRSTVMGGPEHRYMRMLDAMKPDGGGGEVYVLPLNTTGRTPIIPNAPGPNEVDTVLERVQIGHGKVYCGAPVPLRHIRKQLAGLDQSKMSKAIVGGDVPPEELPNTMLGLAFLSMVAHLSPDDRGIYDCSAAKKLAKLCGV